MHMNDFLIFAEKLVKKYGTASMKKSEDCIADVANKLMEAYYMYDPDYHIKYGYENKGSREGFMYSYGKQAIYHLKMRKSRNLLSIDSSIPIKDDKQEYSNYVNEELNNIFELVNKMDINDRDKEIFFMYSHGYIFSEIGDKFGISKQRAEQIYSKIINNLRNVYGTH